MKEERIAYFEQYMSGEQERQVLREAIKEARSAAEDDVRDAWRYRWLRDYGHKAAIYVPYNHHPGAMVLAQDIQLDKACDEGLAENQTMPLKRHDDIGQR